MRHTYNETASDFRLWQEFVDPDATMTESEFDAMTVDEKVALQIEAFGPEPKNDED